MSSTPAAEKKTRSFLLLQGHFDRSAPVSDTALRESLYDPGYEFAAPEPSPGARNSLFITDQAVTQAAEQALATLDRLQWEAALIVAVSWDCLIAARLAALHPSRISGLLLVDPLPSHGLPWRDAAALWEKAPYPKLIVATAREEGLAPQLLQEQKSYGETGSELMVLEQAEEDRLAPQLAELIQAFLHLRCR